jgi:hypothetical protein
MCRYPPDRLCHKSPERRGEKTRTQKSKKEEGNRSSQQAGLLTEFHRGPRCPHLPLKMSIALPPPQLDDDAQAAGGAFAANWEGMADLGDRVEQAGAKKKRKCPDVSGLTVALTKRFPHKVRIKPLLPVARFIESHRVQTIIALLFVLDVVIVLAELIIETEVLRLERDICESELGRLQNETQGCIAVRQATTAPLDNSTTTDPGGGIEAQRAVLQSLETAETVLHWVSIGILVRSFLFVCRSYSFAVHLCA